MDASEKTIQLLKSFSSTQDALTCVRIILDDLQESFDVARELHPHAAGLIAGGIAAWQGIKSELFEYEKNNS